MTYALERSAITAYFVAQWAGATPLGLDGHKFTPVYNSVRLTIQSGRAMQGSVGKAPNSIWYLGMVTATVFTEGGLGSAAWRGYAETIQTMLFEKTIDNAGALITTMAASFVRFSPPQLGDGRHPYIGADFDDAPFHLTNIIAPFVRYGLR